MDWITSRDVDWASAVSQQMQATVRSVNCTDIDEDAPILVSVCAPCGRGEILGVLDAMIDRTAARRLTGTNEITCAYPDARPVRRLAFLNADSG